MTRSEQINIIVDHLSDNLKQYRVPKEVMRTHVNNAIELIKAKSIQALKDGKKVDLIGFGAMTVKNVSERQYKHIQTGETAVSPARKKVSMKPNKKLKDAVKLI